MKFLSNVRLLCVSTMVCSVAVGCGSSPNGADPDGGMDVTPDGKPAPLCPQPLAARLFPLSVGSTWSYTITEPGKPTKQKSAKVEAYEDIGGAKAGIMGYRLRSEKLDGVTVSWQQDTCESVIRHREQSYDIANVFLTDQIYTPSKLRVDETAAHTAAGATWLVSYSETELNKVTGATKTVSKDENWSVVAISESITVPAGTFNAIHLRKTTSGSADKSFWFAPGIGKLKETGSQTEELLSYTIAGM
jgi:hypothetical protein